MFFPFMGGATASATNCPNCGHSPYHEKDSCEKCGFLKPKTNKLPDAWFIFCSLCGCHYMSESGGCPLHNHGPHITKPKLT